MTTKGGDVVVLVMPGVPVVYLGRVLNDGEGLDTIKERFTISMRRHALADAKALASADGRILQWVSGDNEPSPWPES